jgi:NTE family protein
VPVNRLDRIVRSVQAFRRSFSKPSSKPESARIEPRIGPRIGLALGGGFARGIAHIGVIKVLEEENIPIDFIAGTSVGALVGAAYCSGVSAAELEQCANRVRFKHFARWTLSRYGFANSQPMIGFLNSLLKVETFEELRIPLAVTATDFTTGEGVIFRSGPLVDAVRASCAYPGMFLPVKVRGRTLVDGMLAYAVPAIPLRGIGADRVLAVHIKGYWTNEAGPRHMFDVIGQCFAIAQDMNCSPWKQASDLVLEPEVDGYRYDDFEHSTALVRAGVLAARAAMPEIRKWLRQEFPRPSAVQPAKAARLVVSKQTV